MRNPIAEAIQDHLNHGRDIPTGLVIKAVIELERQQEKLESVIVPWAGLTDKLKATP
jgi:hypothetical protein